jgi:hypothetical protein
VLDVIITALAATTVTGNQLHHINEGECTMRKMKIITKAALAGAALLMASQASAVIISTDNTITDTIPGLTGFSTTGSMMDGMSVTAIFTSGLNQTLSWADTGANSGGVTGTGWSLSVTGDTFNDNAWTMDTGNLTLTDLILDGTTGLTVFDRTFDNLVGTAGSALGKDIDTGVTAQYSRQVAIAPDAPVGDLWHVVSVDFTDVGSGGVSGTFTFSQDTDNDSRFADVPAPAPLLLVGIGLIGMSIARHYKKQA